MGIFVCFGSVFCFALSWIGTFATTCTQNDTDSLLTGMILSAPFYLAGVSVLLFQRLNNAALLMAAPLLAFLLWQALWGARLVWLVYVADLATCNLITGEYFGHVTSPIRERVFAAYYLTASLLAVAAQHVASRTSDVGRLAAIPVLHRADRL